MLGLFPAQAAAENAAAAAQLHRHEIVIGSGETRAGKPHQYAAIVDPPRQPVARVGRDIADIGEDDHRQALFDELVDRLRGRSAIGKPDIGERAKCPGQVECRRQQRLRDIGRRAGHDADGTSPPALVEKLDGAG